ncbi:MAG TPA: hypothetical protein VNX66_09840 [Candidatus Sulfotelmatobacter sp.]|jgi:hypothetical protein|nr:hypothetical protein [Candidatus Sulfotelmatobacter sp.]
MVSMKEAVRESIVDESCGEAGPYKALVRCFAHWKLGYILSLMTIRPQFLDRSNEVER